MFRWIILLAMIFFLSCVKEEYKYKSEGTITGQDYRMCVCCGGWFITIDEKQYLFNTLPGDAGFSLDNEKFPLAVKLDWTLNASGCPNTITIQKIQKE